MRIGLALAIALASTPAFAHHVDGRMLPQTPIEGLLSGLGHPIIGWDHLAFVIGIGLLAARWERGWVAIVAFVLATLAGCLVHVARVNVPGVEIAIGLSLIALALALLLGTQSRLHAIAVGLAVAGLVHGYAYGESIVGAETTPLVYYLAGFTAVQAAIAFAAQAAALVLAAGPRAPAMRAAGAALAIVAVIALSG
jgi:urease accessory protein